MKKTILLALSWPLFTYPLLAQKEKIKEESQEIIIIKSGDKEKKLTIETKDGEVFINGKPSKEYKDGDVNVIRQKFKNDRNFVYGPGGDNFKMFDNNWSDKAWSDKGFLGVNTEKADDGVKVTDVTKGSAAEKAGLNEGDIITKVGDKKITDTDDLVDALNSYKPKEEVTISYKRGGKSAAVKTILGQRTLAKSFSYNGDGLGYGDFTMPKIAAIPHDGFTMAWGSSKGRLGVRIEDTENESGAKITEVNNESSASKAGLIENDIITEINGKKVKDVNEARKEMTEVRDKASYNIKVKRNGADMNFEIKIPKKINKADL